MPKNTVQSVEPNIADLVNGWLKSYKLDYKLEQESLNASIDKALDEYKSKQGGTGGNRPDCKLLAYDSYGIAYPVLIEYKGYKDKLVKLDDSGNVAIKTADNKNDYKNINSYAVNGAVVHTENLAKHAAIFVTTACHKSAHNGQFNYGHNFYAKDADNLYINLPVKDGNPDYAAMETFISAVQKLVIKDVVQYADKKIAATKEVTHQKEETYQFPESYGELKVAEHEPPYGEKYGK